jgi:hypothetical protein
LFGPGGLRSPELVEDGVKMGTVGGDANAVENRASRLMILGVLA